MIRDLDLGQTNTELGQTSLNWAGNNSGPNQNLLSQLHLYGNKIYATICHSQEYYDHKNEFRSVNWT